VTTTQAIRLLSAAKVRHLLATKRWRRVCRGVLVAHDGDLTIDATNWVAVLAAGPGAVLAGAAAARAGGLRGAWRRDAIDVLVPGHRHGPDLRRRLPLGMPGVRVRRSDVLPPDDVQRARPTRTSMARSVVDAAQWSRTSDEARMLVASACQQRLVTPQEVLAVVGRLPRARRRRLATQTAADAAGGAQSLAEIDFVRLCRRHRLPPPDLQERRKDSSGRIRYLDAYWRAFRVQAEVDGAHHMEVRHWEADMDRQNDVWIGGDVIVRFTAAGVRNRPDRVAAKLRRALVEADRRGSTPGGGVSCSGRRRISVPRLIDLEPAHRKAGVR